MWCLDNGSKSMGSLGIEESQRMAQCLGVLVALLEAGLSQFPASMRCLTSMALIL